MFEPIPLAQVMIFRMKILQMTIAELSGTLLQYATANSQLSFTTPPIGAFQSDKCDIAALPINGQLAVRVAEPLCGIPVLQQLPSDTSSDLRMCEILIDGMAQRRATLRVVAETLISHLDEFPRLTRTIKMSDIADACSIHVTTVSRALDNKLCLTEVGEIALKKCIVGFQ